jgi:hypothetical protein
MPCYPTGQYDEDARQHPLRRNPGRDAGIQSMDGNLTVATKRLGPGFEPLPPDIWRNSAHAMIHSSPRDSPGQDGDHMLE